METKWKGLVFCLESVPLNDCSEKREGMVSEEHAVAEITSRPCRGPRRLCGQTGEDAGMALKKVKMRLRPWLLASEMCVGGENVLGSRGDCRSCFSFLIIRSMGIKNIGKRPSCAEWQFKRGEDKEHQTHKERCFNLRCLHSCMEDSEQK